MARVLEAWAEALSRSGVAVRSPRRYVAATVVAVHALLLYWIWATPHPWIDALQAAARGFVELTLPVNLVMFGVIVVGVLVVWGRIPFAAIGLTRRGLATAVLATFALWCALNLLALLGFAILGVPFELGVQDHTAATAVGAILAQLVGNSLFEEAVYRGYLAPHAVDLARRRWRPVPAMLIGVAVSQLVFALKHIPHRLHHGIVGAELALSLVMLWCFGVAMTILYLRTRNLWIAIGVHSLWNAPTIMLDPRW